MKASWGNDFIRRSEGSERMKEGVPKRGNRECKGSGDGKEQDEYGWSRCVRR